MGIVPSALVGDDVARGRVIAILERFPIGLYTCSADYAECGREVVSRGIKDIRHGRSAQILLVSKLSMRTSRSREALKLKPDANTGESTSSLGSLHGACIYSRTNL